MSAANASAVDAALVARLAADATLQGMLPDGIYVDVAPASKTRFVIVQFQTHEIEEGFGMSLYETFRYRITARGLATTGVDANAAAFRIHELLYWMPLQPIAGYTHMETLEVERVKFTEVDAIDNDIRWQIAGGDYEIFVSPTAAGMPDEFTPTFDGRVFDVT
jgi:hypothetical protein